jgi:16S rRNA (cytosine1402-N4)-methyltransferase
MRLIGIDADSAAQTRAKERLAPFAGRVEFVNAYFDEFWQNEGLGLHPDLVLMDLGISMFHYELSGRGFSFRKDELLDMRINPERGEGVAELLARLPEEEIADIIYKYGEERYSRRIARAIVAERKRAKITSASALADIIYGAVPGEARHGKLHPATRSFQALRIAVNDELGRLERGMAGAVSALAPLGKLGIISFHSLEDGLIKRYFREISKNCTCPPEQPICTCGGQKKFDLLTRKPIEASERETAENPPSRSAKLRVIQKVDVAHE